MLSRPSRDEPRSCDMLAAKACSPRRDSIQLRRGSHAFAAGRMRVTTSMKRAAKAWHPPGIPKAGRQVTLPTPLFVSAS